jgi:hypothetical protein
MTAGIGAAMDLLLKDQSEPKPIFRPFEVTEMGLPHARCLRHNLGGTLWGLHNVC